MLVRVARASALVAVAMASLTGATRSGSRAPGLAPVVAVHVVREGASAERVVLVLHVEGTGVSLGSYQGTMTFDPATISLISAHQQGGARLGTEESTSACDLRGQVWGTRNVFVCDGSVFPSSSSSHTMTPIITMAHALTDRLLMR